MVTGDARHFQENDPQLVAKLPAWPDDAKRFAIEFIAATVCK